VATFAQRAAYQALVERLALLDLDLMIGVPRALQRLPAAYLESAVIEASRSKFTLVAYRPTLTLAVSYQENAAAEYQLVDLVDLVASDLHGRPLMAVCRCTLTRVDYDYRAVAGIDYRVADLTLALENV
jgi:hypothetical protein